MSGSTLYSSRANGYSNIYSCSGGDAEETSHQYFPNSRLSRVAMSSSGSPKTKYPPGTRTSWNNRLGKSRQTHISLDKFFRKMREAKVPGPYHIRNVHLGNKSLGCGAQFEVFGCAEVFANLDLYTEVDKPYKVADADARGPIRRLIVAVKRPVFVLPASEASVTVDNEDDHSYRTANSFRKRRSPTTFNVSGSGFGTPRQLHDLELEVFALCQDPLRNHPNIVRLIAWGLDIDPEQGNNTEWIPGQIKPLLVVEHANCTLTKFVGNSTTVLGSGKDNFVPEQVMQHLLLDVVRGLGAIHECKIIHGDIKLDNVLVFPQDREPYFVIAKLSDFGLSVNEHGKSGDVVYGLGTPGWMAPELDQHGVEVNADALKKCDFFSVGLLVWGVAAGQARCPLSTDGSQASNALKLAVEFFEGQKCPWQREARARMSDIARLLLPRNPEVRTGDLGPVRGLLESAEHEEFDKTGTWARNRFIDDTPWDILFQQRDLYGMTPHLKKFGSLPCERESHAPTDPNPGRHSSTDILHAWRDILHYFPGVPSREYKLISDHYLNALVHVASRYGTKPVPVLAALVGNEISGSDLLSFCFDGRSSIYEGNIHDRGGEMRIKCSMATAVAAALGYLPAQALCARFISGIENDLRGTFVAEIREMEFCWQRDAVASGFVLGWDFKATQPQEFEAAVQTFRERGGYNTHYCCLTESTEPSSNSVEFSDSGLLVCRGLSWLQQSPLHRAAALGATNQIEQLLGEGYGVNIDARDSRGETALLKAAMAGSEAAVYLLVRGHGANPSIHSPCSGTLPLHWLFMFPDECIAEVAQLLAPDPILLQHKSFQEFQAFHFPFRWPAGTPLAWAVLANNTTAIEVLIGMGSQLLDVDEFFPTVVVDREARIGWDEKNSQDLTPMECFRSWVYTGIQEYVPTVLNSCGKFITQLYQFHAQTVRSEVAIQRRDKYLYGNPLVKAIVQFDRESDAEIEKLLDTGGGDIYINQASGRYGYPLQAAAMRGKANVVKMLLSRGAEVNARGGLWDENALFAAIDNERENVISVLLEWNALVNCTHAISRFTPLAAAARKGNLAMVRMLLPPSLRANVDPTSALAAAVHHPTTSVELLEILIDAGAVIHGENIEKYEPPLTTAAFVGNAPVVQKLLERGAQVNVPGGTPPTTALHSAATMCDLRTMRILLKHGADPNTFSEQGKYAYPLQSVAYYGSLPAVRLLLDYGADMNAQGGFFGNALQAAAYIGNMGMVRLLVDRGVDVDAHGGKYGTALAAAREMGHEDIVAVLLDMKLGIYVGSEGRTFPCIVCITGSLC